MLQLQLGPVPLNRPAFLMSIECVYKRVEPSLCLANVADELRTPAAAPPLLVEAVDQTLERSEPVWSTDPSPDLVGQLPADAFTPTSQLGKARYGSYRLIDWLTATGLLVASLASVFAVNRNLF